MNLRFKFVRFVDLLGAVIFSIITIVCSAQIINRYFFNSSFSFADELAVQLMIWIAFLGAAKCVADDSHTRLSVLINPLPPHYRVAAAMLSNLLCIGFLAVAIWYGMQLVQTSWRATTTGTGIPEGLVYLAMPVGGVIMILFLIGNSVEAVRYGVKVREEVE